MVLMELENLSKPEDDWEVEGWPQFYHDLTKTEREAIIQRSLSDDMLGSVISRVKRNV